MRRWRHPGYPSHVTPSSDEVPWPVAWCVRDSRGDVVNAFRSNEQDQRAISWWGFTLCQWIHYISYWIKEWLYILLHFLILSILVPECVALRFKDTVFGDSEGSESELEVPQSHWSIPPTGGEKRCETYIHLSVLSSRWRHNHCGDTKMEEFSSTGFCFKDLCFCKLRSQYLSRKHWDLVISIS